MLDSNQWAKGVLTMTEHKLIESLESMNKDDIWTMVDLEKIRNATQALHNIQLIHESDQESEHTSHSEKH